jgi:hypothetical protein
MTRVILVLGILAAAAVVIVAVQYLLRGMTNPEGFGLPVEKRVARIQREARA